MGGGRLTLKMVRTSWALVPAFELSAWSSPTARSAAIPVRRIAMSGTPRAAFSGSDEKAVWYITRVRYSPKMVALRMPVRDWSARDFAR